jgi:hypothetical protein
MSEEIETSASRQTDVEIARERTKQVNHVVTIASLTALFGAGVLFCQPVWPVAAGVAALGAMAAAICFFILQRG